MGAALSSCSQAALGRLRQGEPATAGAKHAGSARAGRLQKVGSIAPLASDAVPCATGLSTSSNPSRRLLAPQSAHSAGSDNYLDRNIYGVFGQDVSCANVCVFWIVISISNFRDKHWITGVSGVAAAVYRAHAGGEGDVDIRRRLLSNGAAC